MEPASTGGQEQVVTLPANYIDPPSNGERPFEEIYARHAPLIHRYVARRLGADLAEDITAQVFVEAISHWSSFDPGRGTETGWLYGIATNLIRRHHRRETRAHLAHERMHRRHVADDTTGVTVARVSAEADWSRVAAVLADLNSADRDILLLFAWAELPYDAIAEIVGLPVGTVKSRISRARTKLRQRLGTIDGPEESL